MEWKEAFNFEDLLIAATRYYIGRMTISSCDHADKLAIIFEKLPNNIKVIIERDIEEMFKKDDTARKNGEKYLPLGMDVDRKAWEQVREKYKK